MPTNHTEHYQLNQWERSDKVLMEDFNADNAKIDAALGGKADISALNRLLQTVTEQGAAIAKLGNCRIEAFAYTGTGGNSHSVTFSAKPVFFLLAGVNTAVFGGGPGSPVSCVYNVDGRSANTSLTASWSGKTVTLSGDSRAVANNINVVYCGAAFFAQDA